jgi:hypothetical protein
MKLQERNFSMDSKFSGALAKLNQHSAKQQPTTPDTPLRGRGRPRSKSSDPDYQSTTVILRKRTKRTAARLLEDMETGQDLSDLIEELLIDWIQKHA